MSPPCVPFVFLAVKLTVNCPPEALLYVCDGFCEVEVLPSPKFHSKPFAFPINVPVKFTVVGEGPLVGVPTKLACPTYLLFAMFKATWLRSSIPVVTFVVVVQPSYATSGPDILPSAGVPRFIVLPCTDAMFAPVVQLNVPLPFVVSTCPLLPPVIVTAVIAPKFTALPLKFNVLSDVNAFPASVRFAILAVPGACKGCAGVAVPIPTRLLVTSMNNVLVSTARLVVLSRLLASALPVTLAMAINYYP